MAVYWRKLSFVRCTVAGIASFWFWSIAGSAVMAILPRFGLFIKLFLPGPSTIFAYHLILERYQATNRRWCALLMLLGIWVAGPWFMMAGMSFQGGGFTTLKASDMLFLFSPLGTFIMATYDATLGSLILASIYLLIAPPGKKHFPPCHCQKCEYDLTGNSSGVCPECGERI